MSDRKYNIFLSGVGGRLEINKSRFVSKHIDAKCCGGHVEGTLYVNIDTDPYQYEGELNFSRIILEELAQKGCENRKTVVRGFFYGRIKYWGSGTDPKNFYAEGQFNVNEGFLSEVPIIYSVFNFLNLTSKKEIFHSAQAKFIVKDGIVHIDEGKVYSDSTELNGRGDIDLDGNMHITIVAGFSRGFFLKSLLWENCLTLW